MLSDPNAEGSVINIFKIKEDSIELENTLTKQDFNMDWLRIDDLTVDTYNDILFVSNRVSVKKFDVVKFKYSRNGKIDVITKVLEGQTGQVSSIRTEGLSKVFMAT